MIGVLSTLLFDSALKGVELDLTECSVWPDKLRLPKNVFYLMVKMHRLNKVGRPFSELYFWIPAFDGMTNSRLVASFLLKPASSVFSPNY